MWVESACGDETVLDAEGVMEFLFNRQPLLGWLSSTLPWYICIWLVAGSLFNKASHNRSLSSSKLNVYFASISDTELPS